MIQERAQNPVVKTERSRGSNAYIKFQDSTPARPVAAGDSLIAETQLGWRAAREPGWSGLIVGDGDGVIVRDAVGKKFGTKDGLTPGVAEAEGAGVWVGLKFGSGVPAGKVSIAARALRSGQECRMELPIKDTIL